jgi:hypothetical protein
MSTDNPSFVYGRRGQSLARTRMLLDGSTLTVEQLLEIASFKSANANQEALQLDLTPGAWQRVKVRRRRPSSRTERGEGEFLWKSDVFLCFFCFRGVRFDLPTGTQLINR